MRTLQANHRHSERPVVSAPIPYPDDEQLARERGLRILLSFFAFIFLALALFLLVRGGQLLAASGMLDFSEKSAEPQSVRLSSAVSASPMPSASLATEAARYDAELGQLQARMAGLLKESVEKRIRELEHNLQRGQLGADGLKAIEEIKSELMFLQGFAASGGKALAEDDPERFRPHGSAQGLPAAIAEAAELRAWYYFGVASFGLSAVMLLGACWRIQKQIRLMENMRRSSYFPARFD